MQQHARRRLRKVTIRKFESQSKGHSTDRTRRITTSVGESREQPTENTSEQPTEQQTEQPNKTTMQQQHNIQGREPLPSPAVSPLPSTSNITRSPTHKWPGNSPTCQRCPARDPAAAPSHHGTWPDQMIFPPHYHDHRSTNLKHRRSRGKYRNWRSSEKHVNRRMRNSRRAGGGQRAGEGRRE